MNAMPRSAECEIAMSRIRSRGHTRAIDWRNSFSSAIAKKMRETSQHDAVQHAERGNGPKIETEHHVGFAS